MGGAGSQRSSDQQGLAATLRSFWQGRKVLITGSTSFHGAWLGLVLVELGADVVGCDIPPKNHPDAFVQLGLAARMPQHPHHPAEPGVLARLVDEVQPEAVFHLATESHEPQSNLQTAEPYATSLLGTLALLDALRATRSARALVHVITTWAYPSNDGHPQDEKQRLRGRDALGASLVCSEVATEAAWAEWAEAQRMGIATARSGNAIGGGDWRVGGLLPDCVAAVREGTQVELRLPAAVRPWIFVLDSVLGYLELARNLLAEPEEFSRPWNLGPLPGSEPTVEQLARTLVARLGGREDAVWTGPELGQSLCRLDSSMARRELGWRPRLDWRTAVDRAGEWYAAWAEGEDLAALSQRQVRDHLALLEGAELRNPVGRVGTDEVTATMSRESLQVLTGVGSLPGTETISIRSPSDAAVAGPSRSCRWCGAGLERVLVDLGKSPLANSFVPWSRRDEPEVFLPLRTYVCDGCLLVQVPEFAPADSIFSDYLYFSSFSSTWLEHNARLAASLIERLDLGKTSRVIEVASNDGYLLRNFVDAGVPCLGVEPAANVAQVAIDAGIPTRIGFFGWEMGRELVEQGGAADLVFAINVLAHVPDLRGFVGGLAELLAEDGVLHLEFPSLHFLLRDGLFDTIYHEHFSYFSLTVVDRILSEVGLRVFDVEVRPTHGGSLRVLACRAASECFERSDSVAACLQEERAFGLDDARSYAGLQERADKIKEGLLTFLLNARSEGKRVVGYGAPAKGNTLLNYCGIGRDLLAYTVDLSPHKQGTWLPGTGIPVFSPDILEADPPDFVLILPWNLSEEIVKQLDGLRARGTAFVVALPELEVIA